MVPFMALHSRLQRIDDRLEADQPDPAAVGRGRPPPPVQAIPHDLGVWFSLDPVTPLPTRFEPRFPDGRPGTSAGRGDVENQGFATMATRSSMMVAVPGFVAERNMEHASRTLGTVDGPGARRCR